MIFTVSLELDNFNPRSREGSDGIIILFFFGVCNFNPRSREGSDTQAFDIKTQII